MNIHFRWLTFLCSLLFINSLYPHGDSKRNGGFTINDMLADFHDARNRNKEIIPNILEARGYASYVAPALERISKAHFQFGQDLTRMRDLKSWYYVGEFSGENNKTLENDLPVNFQDIMTLGLFAHQNDLEIEILKKWHHGTSEVLAGGAILYQLIYGLLQEEFFPKLAKEKLHQKTADLNKFFLLDTRPNTQKLLNRLHFHGIKRYTQEDAKPHKIMHHKQCRVVVNFGTGGGYDFFTPRPYRGFYFSFYGLDDGKWTQLTQLWPLFRPYGETNEYCQDKDRDYNQKIIKEEVSLQFKKLINEGICTNSSLDTIFALDQFDLFHAITFNDNFLQHICRYSYQSPSQIVF